MNIDLLEAEVYEHETKCLKLKAFTAVISDDHVSTIGYGKDEYILWKSTDSVIHWDVEFVNTGQLDISIKVGNDEDNVGSEVEIEVDGERMVSVPSFTGGLDQPITVKLGSINVTKTGCFSVKMKAKSIKGEQVGKFWFMELSGDAAVDSVEDMLPRLVDDVHLNWVLQGGCDILYCAVTPIESHMGTEFTPIHLGPAHFSLLDTDYEGNQCIYCYFSPYDDEAPFDVIYRTPFLQEDDSGFVYPWNINETYHFLAKVVHLPDENAFLYLCYLYFNNESKWKLMMASKRSNYTTLITEFTSVVRSQYGEQMGYFPREAAFGPAWARLSNGEWKELTSCDYTKFGTLFNTDAFVKDNRVHLRTGGRTKETNKLGTAFNLQPSDKLPEILEDIDSKLESVPSE